MLNEVSGTLVSGNSFRVTPYVVEIRSSTGTTLKAADVNALVAVRRDGNTVFVQERTGESFTMSAQSLDDAGQIEALIRQSIATSTAAPVARATGIPRAWIITGSIVAAVVLLAIIGAIAGGLPSDDVAVTYRVTDSEDGSVSLTYRNAGGNSQQNSSSQTPWSRAYTMQSGDFVYVSAQRQGGSGTVHCRIIVDGKVIEEAESTGDFVIATCSGRVP